MKLADHYHHLLAGDSASIASLFPFLAALDSPLSGQVDGHEALADYVDRERKALTPFHPSITVINRVRTDLRDVIELEVVGNRDGLDLDLPVVLVGDRSGAGYGRIRIYHSTWPLTGRHKYRPPVIWPGPPIDEPAIINAYFDALAKGDRQRILTTFAPRGSLREPSGKQFLHVGTTELNAFYSAAFAQPGGVPLVHAAATQDGLTFVVEYICDRWGAQTFPPVRRQGPWGGLR